MTQKENITEAVPETSSSNYTDTYRIHGGRKYNANSQYILPVDEEEDGRLNRFFLAYINLFDGAHKSPVKEQLEKGIKVLDNACGKGAHWSVTQAIEFPNSDFLGVDVSNVFPSKDARPPNTNFVLGDASKKIPAPDNTFDFAYQKLVGLSFSNEDWINNIKELYRVVKPGGYVELTEFHITSPYNTGPLMDKLTHALITSVKSRNTITNAAPIELPERLGAAGFINQTAFTSIMPLNNGEHGEMYWATIREAFLAFRPIFSDVYPEWKDIEFYENYLDFVEEECATYKTFYEWYVCYAKK